MTEKEKCFEKITYFSEKGANKALRFQPDKRKYKCPYCKHWHLSSTDNTFDREAVANFSSNRGKLVIKKEKQHYLCRYDGKIFHTVFKFKRNRRAIEVVQVIENKNQLPKFLWELYTKAVNKNEKDFRNL